MNGARLNLTRIRQSIRQTSIRQLLSYLLLACGAALILISGRTLLEWHLGQSDASSQFERPVLPSSRSLSQPVPGHNPKIPNGQTIAKLTIPRLHVQLYVVEGD